jgi:hypothetical protein
LENYEPAETVLEGFTITGGVGYGAGGTPHGGGIYIEWGSPTIRYNHVVYNEAAISGGVYVRNGGANVHNNVIAWNHASEGGGGIVCTACSGAYRYNTVYENTTDRDGPAGEYFWGAGDLEGNIFVLVDQSKEAFRFMDPREDKEWSSAYNLLWPDVDVVGGSDADAWPSTEGWVYEDPQLMDSGCGDWHLSTTSPAIDAGPPSQTDADGSPADMGAFGGPDGEWPW